MLNHAIQNFHEQMAQSAQRVEQAMEKRLSDQPAFGEITRPQHLIKAMRHGALNGGKRLRPFLVLQSTHIFGGHQDAALDVAVALECIHCYSLVHDDLPAMDNDDLRRGKPTVHIAFDEATAILAGDGLLTLAFDILSDDKLSLPAAQKLALISALSKAAGVGGMVGGQALDLAAETKTPDEPRIVQLQQMKTGALIRYACEAGAIIGGATEQQKLHMSDFGTLIGQAFQLADDLLDITSDAKTMGKKTGKDADHGKATLVGIHGVDWARRELDRLYAQSVAVLQALEQDTNMLEKIADFVIKRDR